jgi:predicted ATP-dependent serine protease
MEQLTEQHRENIGKAISVSVPPKISHSIAIAGLATHYFGKGVPTAIGGLIGFLLGSKMHLSDEKKYQTMSDILSSQNALVTDQESDINEKGMGIMSANELVNHTYTKYDFTGKWEKFIGQPSINFHAMIYGRPKQGKSILAVQLAQYLSEEFGRVLYVASEEGFSVTLQKKVSEFASNNPNLDFANYRNYKEIKEALFARKYAFVFIDSVNFIKITPEEIEDLKAANKKTAFITIQQATKSGNFRGSQEFAHNCDMVIRVEAGQASHQGRFQEPTEMAVFDKPESDNKKAPDTNMGADSNKTNNSQMEMFVPPNNGESNF